MSITAKELSKKLNLSEAAISLALHNKPGVSTKTRKRILDAAIEFGYDFTRISPSGSSSEPKNIYLIIYRKNGILVTDTPFFSQLSEGIDLECKQHNYILNTLFLYEGDDIPKHLNMIKQNGAKGIILLGTQMQELDISSFSKCPVPIVLLDNYFENHEMDCVLINNLMGAFSATDYLIQQTKTQPGYLHSSYSLHNFEERATGFDKALHENGMSSFHSIIHKVAPSVEGAYADIKNLLAQNIPIASCYFADNDFIAIGAIRAFQEHGYEIPKDIRIIGFDDIPHCIYISPPLSSIRVPQQYMGQIAVRRLHEQIVNPQDTFVKIEVAANLILRKSS